MRRKNLTNINSQFSCDCGKSYFSASALSTHKKIKHPFFKNSQRLQFEKRGPITVRKVNLEVDPNEFEKEDIIEKQKKLLEKICKVFNDEDKKNRNYIDQVKTNIGGQFFSVYYKSYNPRNKTIKFNEKENLFEDSMLNVFSEFLLRVHSQLEDIFCQNLAMIFMRIIYRGIYENNKDKKQHLLGCRIGNIGQYSNYTLLSIVKEFRTMAPYSGFKILEENTFCKLMQCLYSWLFLKRYSTLSIETNMKYFKSD